MVRAGDGKERRALRQHGGGLVVVLHTRTLTCSALAGSHTHTRCATQSPRSAQSITIIPTPHPSLSLRRSLSIQAQAVHDLRIRRAPDHLCRLIRIGLRRRPCAYSAFRCLDDGACSDHAGNTVGSQPGACSGFDRQKKVLRSELLINANRKLSCIEVTSVVTPYPLNQIHRLCLNRCISHNSTLNWIKTKSASDRIVCQHAPGTPLDRPLLLGRLGFPIVTDHLLPTQAVTSTKGTVRICIKTTFTFRQNERGWVR